MSTKVKNWLIRILFRLIDAPDSGEIDERTEKLIDTWLAETYEHPGFRLYMKFRTQKFYKYLSGGAGMKELPRDDYVRGIGQRFENARLAQSAKKAFEKKVQLNKSKGMDASR